MSDYLDQLNPVQRQAVTTIDGPVMVIAGPGSGKTRVLTYRIAHLIESGVPPWEVLALTFTNKAAREMQERIAKVVGERARKVWAGTFHSTFAKILRIESEKIGYPNNFTIYDREDSKNVVKAVLTELNLSQDVYNVNAVLNRISSAKTNLITPKAYVKNEDLMSKDRIHRRPHFHQVYAKYVERCKRSGAMDFDDLLFRLFELFQKDPDGALAKYREKFRYILVDEFQDTNFLQYAIVKKLVRYEGSPQNICIVGDDAQSIYAFRGATIENILNFEKDFPQLQVFKLEQNYRSTDHIVKAANQVITHNRKQIPKEIWSDKGTGHKIKLIKAMADTEEGKRIADTIIEQKNRFHLQNSDIAILYRTNAQSRIFEEYLRRYNLPYRVYGGLSFYQRKEVKDLIAYLRLAVNPNDEEALRRVINYPKRGIGKTSVDKISRHAGENEVTMWEAIPQVPISGRGRNNLDKFVDLIKTLRQWAAEKDAFEAAKEIVQQSGIIEHLGKDNSIEGLGRIENINSLLDGIKEFVENDELIDEEFSDDRSLAKYLQNIALLTDLDENSKEGDFVTLMSVHAAKGLEFKSIFVVGLEEKLFPSFMSMDTPEGLDEERRLFYVAITRAKQFLALSYANSRYKFGKMVYNKPSRFLEEINPQHVDGVVSSRGRQVSAGGNRSGVSGLFKPRSSANQAVPVVNPKDFKPNAPTEIQAGMKVLHMKFGEGKVLAIDGANDGRVATIFFKDLDDGTQKRIMLKFAKLQIL